MKYEWNKQILENQKRKALVYLKRKNLTQEQKDSVLDVLSNIHDLQNIQSRNNKGKKEKYLDPKCYLTKKIYEDYHDIPYWVKEISLKSMSSFETWEKRKTTPLPTEHLSNETLLHETYQFALWTKKKEYIQFFKNYYLDRNDFLQFFQKENSLDYGQLETIFYKNQYFPFIYVNKWNTIEDIGTLIHESLHAYFFRKNKNLTMESDYYYISEVEGDFADYLFPYYLEEKNLASKTTIENLKNQYFLNKFQEFSEFYYIYKLCKIYHQEKEITIEKLTLEYLKDSFFKIDENILNTSIQSPTWNAKYLMSFLIFLDIVETNQKDPQKCFDIISKIRFNQKENVLSILEKNNVHFFEDHYKNLRKVLTHYQK